MKSSLAILLASSLVANIYGLPVLNPHEETLVPFSLSPGNVNLETYYLDKYNDENSDKVYGTPQNMFPFNVNEGSNIRLTRQKRSPQHHGGGHYGGTHGGGGGHYGGGGHGGGGHYGGGGHGGGGHYGGGGHGGGGHYGGGYHHG